MRSSPYAERLPYDSDDAALIRVARRDFEKAIKVPADWVARANELGAASYDAWTRARPANDFAAMRPYLEQSLELSREYAGFFAPYDHVADPLIDGADEGMTTAAIRTLFTELRRELVPIVRAITEQPVADDRCLRGAFAEAPQLDFSVVGGASASATTSTAAASTRRIIHSAPSSRTATCASPRACATTTSSEALFSTVHEAGHAMYEQGIDPALEGTPLGSGVSAGVHESQSRLWENVVGRGRAFWEHFYPALQETFPDPFERRAARYLLSRHQQGRSARSSAPTPTRSPTICTS